MGKTTKLSKAEFIEKACDIHGNTYNYEYINYVNTYTKVDIMCKEHGLFSQTPFSHYKLGAGCPKCGAVKAGRSKLGKSFKQPITTEVFIKKANIVHNNKYQYNNAVYTKAADNITVTCSIHGDFSISASKHLNGRGCQECSKLSRSNKQKTGLAKFIEKAKTVHNNLYTYAFADYISSTIKLSITCKEHGNFEQTPDSHLRGSGCPLCANAKQGFRAENFAGKHAIFYVLKLHNGTFKPGITTQQSVERRYNQDNFKEIVEEIVLEISFLDGKDARLFEIEVLDHFKQHKYKGEQVFPKCKNTEILTVDPTQFIISKLKA